MNYFEQRMNKYHSQNPEDSMDSRAEELIYKYFRDNYLRPVMQQNVGNYFIDFAFPELKIGIEYDGDGHKQLPEDDIKRELFLTEKGWKIWRIKKESEGYMLYRKGELRWAFKRLTETIDWLSNSIKDYGNLNIPRKILEGDDDEDEDETQDEDGGDFV